MMKETKRGKVDILIYKLCTKERRRKSSSSSSRSRRRRRRRRGREGEEEEGGGKVSLTRHLEGKRRGERRGGLVG